MRTTPDLHLLPTVVGPPDPCPDRSAATELRDAIATTRARLLDVLHARTRTLHGIATWVGPHRQRYDEDATALLAAGRDLDASLALLLETLDAELDTPRRP